MAHSCVYLTQEDSLFMLLMWWKVCPWHHNKPPGKMGPSSLINPITDASFCPRLLKDTTSLSMYPIPSSKGQCTWHATNTQLGPVLSVTNISTHTSFVKLGQNWRIFCAKSWHHKRYPISFVFQVQSCILKCDFHIFQIWKKTALSEAPPKTNHKKVSS